MDVNDLRAAITVISLAVFVGIVVWAFGARQRKRFDEAANLPFADEPGARSLTGDKRNG